MNKKECNRKLEILDSYCADCVGCEHFNECKAIIKRDMYACELGYSYYRHDFCDCIKCSNFNACDPYKKGKKLDNFSNACVNCMHIKDCVKQLHKLKGLGFPIKPDYLK